MPFGTVHKLEARAGSLSNPATTFFYDPIDQLTRVKSPVGDGTTFAYSDSIYNSQGQVTKSTDPLGRDTTFLYDPDNRLTRVADPLSNATVYAYDRWDHLTKVTDARSNATDAFAASGASSLPPIWVWMKETFGIDPQRKVEK